MSAVPSTASTRAPLLSIADLHVSFRMGREDGVVRRVDAVKGVSFDLPENTTVALVGESGSGKSVTAMSIINLLPENAERSCSITFQGRDLLAASLADLQALRGREIACVFQDPMSSLNPVFTVGQQIAEPLRKHLGMGARQATARAEALLAEVGMPEPKRRLSAYPHQLSGGQQQRVMIAMALACEPKLLIADEPTTALDVTVQHEILRLIAEVRRELGMALILVSHDLAVIEQVCDRLVVMYAGATVETGPVGRVGAEPRHPYTRALRLSRVDTAPPGQDLEAIPGEPPTVGAWPSGCRFWPRCPLGDADCREGGQPGLRPVGQQLTACIHADRLEPVEVGA